MKKKKIFIIIILELSLKLYAVMPDEILTCFYAPNKAMVCYLRYNYALNKSDIGLGTSSIDLIPCNTVVESNYIEFSFINIWIGAEEINKDDCRRLSYYKIRIDNNDIIEGKKDFYNISPVLILKDSKGSVFRHQNDFTYDCEKYKASNFYQVKEDSFVYENADLTSSKIKKISKAAPLKILNVTNSKKSYNDIWLKIECLGVEGYIPLSSLADDWKVVENHLECKKRQGVINDSRVRLRVKPNLTCDTWALLDKGLPVKIKDKSAEPYEIDGEQWYWYYVDAEGYPDGWVYGKYLDIEKE